MRLSYRSEVSYENSMKVMQYNQKLYTILTEHYTLISIARIIFSTGPYTLVDHAPLLRCAINRTEIQVPKLVQ